MLTDDPKALHHDFIQMALGAKPGKRIQQGIYEIYHFGSSDFLSFDNGYYRWDTEDTRLLSIDVYGVCDSIEQIIKQCPELQDPIRQFVITVTPIIRKDEPPSGGWRWHKWGSYIGRHTPEHEYIYDEKNIEKVLVYHIHEKLPPWR